MCANFLRARGLSGKIRLYVRNYSAFISLSIAFFSIRTDGTFLSLPDSSMYALHIIPGEPPSKASFPLIHMEGDPLMLRSIASS